jgi:N-carbamoylputrescine amidase
MRKVTFAATQMACSWDVEANIDRAENLVREAASKGANAILIQELFETPYFCQDQNVKHFELAKPSFSHPVNERMRELAKSFGVVLPVSFFEQAHQAYFNSLAMIDATGEVLGVYRKSHIPDGPGYQEKYYFSPGDTGFKVWDTAYGRFGVAICWDQWFPEAARAMALEGAEALFYPTAIGSEPPPAPPIDSRDHWQRVMQGHAAANIMPLVASNRIGTEKGEATEMTFYGSSFIAGPTGELAATASRDRQEVITASFDLDEVKRRRTGWGIFRDRRPDLYRSLATFDGK